LHAEWKRMDGSKETEDKCLDAKNGPGQGSDAGHTALGMIRQDKPGVFMFMVKDKKVWKDFKNGDKISKSAAEMEAKLPKN